MGLRIDLELYANSLYRFYLLSWAKYSSKNSGNVQHRHEEIQR